MQIPGDRKGHRLFRKGMLALGKEWVAQLILPMRATQQDLNGCLWRERKGKGYIASLYEGSLAEA
eukprot:1144377-Pelagomonas_calceolata.AAC.1